MAESAFLDPDPLVPTADAMDPEAAEMVSGNATPPSWHLAPFWAAVALLALVLMLSLMVWPLRRRIASSRVLQLFAMRTQHRPHIVR